MQNDYQTILEDAERHITTVALNSADTALSPYLDVLPAGAATALTHRVFFAIACNAAAASCAALYVALDKLERDNGAEPSTIAAVDDAVEHLLKTLAEAPARGRDMLAREIAAVERGA